MYVHIYVCVLSIVYNIEGILYCFFSVVEALC